jgi:hypothetical protein
MRGHDSRQAEGGLAIALFWEIAVMTGSVSDHLPSPQGETTLDTWRTNSV